MRRLSVCKLLHRSKCILLCSTCFLNSFDQDPQVFAVLDVVASTKNMWENCTLSIVNLL